MMRVKKVISVIVSILILVVSVSLFICDDAKAAEELQFEDFTYIELDDETVEISKYNGDSSTKELVIPEKINGKKVTSIGDSAFEYCSNLTEVEIPNGVTSIGKKVFFYCTSLTRVKIPSSVTSIGSNAFYNCQSLESVKIPSSVTSIGYKAFCNCSNLKIIEIPPSVTSIVFDAFEGSRVVICGETDSYAHIYADGNGIRFFDGDAFICEDYIYREFDDGTVEILRYAGSKKKVVIPEKLDGKKVISIREESFSYCSNLTSVEIPAGVTNIGAHAFRSCGNLTEIKIPSSVTHIGDGAFCDCRSLENVKIPFGVTDIEDQAFLWCKSLTSIEIPSSVTNIGYGVFHSCDSLTSITVDIASQYYSSEDDILYNKDKTILIKCPEKKKGNVIIPEGVKSIELRAFSGCNSLTGVEIPSSVTYIANFAFEGWNQNFTIYGKAGSMAETYANEKNINFSTESIPREPTPVSAPKIGETFTDAKSKGQYRVTGKQTVSYIKTTATSGKVTIPATVKYKGRTFKVTVIYKGAFKNKTGITAVTFGKYITAVGSEAFSGCKKLKTVTLNKSLTKLGDKAFYNCKSLAQIKIGSKVKTIGKSAFAGCTRLKKVILGTGLTTIGNGAFYKCTALTAITIPKNVKKIGKQAFYGCKNLKTITIKTAKLKSSTVGSNAFKGIYSKATIKVLKSKKTAYQKLLKSKGAGKYVRYK